MALLEVREVEIFPEGRTEHQLEHVGTQQSVGAGYQSPGLLSRSSLQAAQPSVQEYRCDGLQSPPGGVMMRSLQVTAGHYLYDT